MNYRDEIRAATLVSLVNSLLQVEKAFNDSEETSRLKAWATSVSPTDYEKFGVRGFGLSGFQYLRMLLGVQTIKPDVHIRRFVSDAIGRSVGDEEALGLMEAAGKHLKWPLSRLDYAIWDRGARGNENQNSPLYAIALLDELQRNGFTDNSFKIIHHFGRKATIQSYCDYCRESISSFKDDGTNERVCKRLQIIQNAFEAGRFTTPAKPGVFEALAMAARLETSTE